MRAMENATLVLALLLGGCGDALIESGRYSVQLATIDTACPPSRPVPVSDDDGAVWICPHASQDPRLLRAEVSDDDLSCEGPSSLEGMRTWRVVSDSGSFRIVDEAADATIDGIFSGDLAEGRGQSWAYTIAGGTTEVDWAVELRPDGDGGFAGDVRVQWPLNVPVGESCESGFQAKVIE